MPYITQDDRKKFELALDSLDYVKFSTPGELNYYVTCVILQYIHNKGLSYQTINDIQGMFKCCSDEFTRRIVNLYEDSKIKTNGDVY